MTTIAPPPPAPSSPPPPLSPGGRTAFRVLLTAAAVVLVVGTIVSLGVFAWGLTNFRVVTDTAPLPTAMRELVVDTGSVPVAVRVRTDREAGEPRVDLRMVNSTRADAHPMAVSTDRAEARISINAEPTPFLQWSRAAEISVVLPPEVARKLTVRTQQERGVVLAQADLDQLIARIDDGAAVLSGSARRIEIHNVNGEVLTREPIRVSESFSADTENSDIKVEFAEVAPRAVDVSSGNGDVIVSVPDRGPYVVNASTGHRRGDTVIRVPQTSNREAAAAVITARSENGDVVIDESR